MSTEWHARNHVVCGICGESSATLQPQNMENICCFDDVTSSMFKYSTDKVELLSVY